MDCSQDSDLTSYITQEGKELFTNSLALAVLFGKKHAHLVRAIRALLFNEDPEVAEEAWRVFALRFYIDTNGNRCPMFRLSRDGLYLLSLGRGDRIRATRIRLANAFEEVDKRLVARERYLAEQVQALSRRNARRGVDGASRRCTLH